MLFFDLAFPFSAVSLGLHSVALRIPCIVFNDCQALPNVDVSTLLTLSPNNRLPVN